MGEKGRKEVSYSSVEIIFCFSSPLIDCRDIPVKNLALSPPCFA